jgi:DNA-damage-inducible protein D
MSNQTSLFHFDDDQPSFEDVGVANGVTHWSEEILQQALGYHSAESFQKSVLRAKQACLTLGIDTEDHFVRQPDGGRVYTRFACYLIAMNGDPRKQEIAAAQAYFAAIAETFQQKLADSDGIDRLLIREEITDGQKSLVSTATKHGVTNYAFFQNAGYVGMYNMNLSKLSSHKGLKKGEQLIDRMGKEEMAAHLFRITQTDAKIKNEKIQGQKGLEEAAKTVGKKVRKMMHETSGTSPEHLPLAENIKDVKKKLKGTGRSLQNIDKKPAKKKKP